MVQGKLGLGSGEVRVRVLVRGGQGYGGGLRRFGSGFVGVRVGV